MQLPLPTFEDETLAQLRARISEMTEFPLNPRFTTLKAFAAALGARIKVSAYSITAEQVAVLLNIMD
eukprot:15435375-Alexandrium_andersonii.AAC.1